MDRMFRGLQTVMAAGIALVLLVGAMWMWHHSEDLIVEWGVERAAVALWALRVACIAAAAAAQTMLVVYVIGQLYRRDRFSDLLGASAALLFVLALVGAVALGLASR